MTNSSKEKKELAFWRDKINENLKGSSFIESRLMGLEVLPRLIFQLQSNSNDCPECNSLYQETTDFVDHIKEVANPNNVKYRTQFELSTNKTLKHLKLAHRSYPKGKLLSVFLGLSMLIGIIAGIITATLTNSTMINFVILFWVIITAIGYITGKLYEKLLRKEGRLF